MLNKKNRITDRKRIEELGKKGKAYKTPNFVFRFLSKSAPPPDFAVTVSAKTAKNAVDRNRLRRQVQEAIRNNLSGLSENISVLVIARFRTTDKNYQSLTREITQFFKQFSRDAK